MDINRLRHNNGLDYFISRLSKKGYEAIFKEGSYPHGEPDIIAIRRGNIHIYEYKLRCSTMSRERAIEQLKKVKDYFPNMEAKYIFISGRGYVERIRL